MTRILKNHQWTGLTLLVSSLALAPHVVSAQAVQEEGASAARQASAIGEVIVTARKRSESLQDVPVAVTAVSGEVLENSGYTGVADVAHLAPNVFFEGFDRSTPQVYIRGIGTRSYDPGTDLSVGLFVDGVYQARMGGFDTDLLDVERMEVLRGPQGTLYGKNTIAGAISIVTRDPSPTFTAQASVEGGRSAGKGDKLWAFSGQVAGPIVDDRVTASLAVSRRVRDGYLRFVNRDFAGGSEDSWAIRGVTLVDFNPQTSLRLTGFYSNNDGPPLVWDINTFGGARPQAFAVAPGTPNPTYSGDGYLLDTELTDIYLDKVSYGGAATLKWDWGDIGFTSITAYQKQELAEIFDGDGSILDSYVGGMFEKSSQFSEELRAAWSNDKWNVFLGLFYGFEQTGRRDLVQFGSTSLTASLIGAPLVPSNTYFDLDTTSYAAFGQVQYEFTDKLSLTAGARYSIDKKDGKYSRVTRPINTILPDFTFDNKPIKWTSFDPSLSLNYKISPRTLAYVSYSTGYKSGAFQFRPANPSAAAVVADPESVVSYEAGLKSTLFDGRVRANLAAFKMNYSDLQVLRQSADPALPGTVLVVIENAAESSISGLELETITTLSDRFRLTFNYSYLDAKYKKYTQNATLRFDGNRMQRAPKNTVNVALEYEQPLAEGQINARLAYFWRDSIFFEADNNTLNPNASESPIGSWDASITFTRNQLAVTLWGTNLSDERYRRTTVNASPLAQREVWSEPRMVGVKVSLKYQ